jgi:GH43 family beta-xylosidase
VVWSGWEGDTNGQQDIYIAKLKNPWTIEGRRVRLSSPQYGWERHGDLNDPNNPPHVAVNEGPQFLTHKNKVFLVYSASGCWTDNYSLGLLSAGENSNLLDSLSWTKNPEPVFSGSVENGVSAPAQGCGRNRSPRAQRFSWDSNGMPFFGQPVKEGQRIPVPAEGNKKRRATVNQ